MLARASVLTAVLIAAVPNVAHAAIISVSPGDDYSVIEAAEPGDIVEIQPGTYQFRVFLDAQASADNPLVIRAADPNQRPVWDLGGQNVESWPGSYTGGDNGRGCWQVTGSNIQISGIEFHNCHTASGNAPGIRINGAEAVTVRDALFLDNDVGFSGLGEDIAVEFSEFQGNGRVSNPPQHSIYIFGGSFALRYSYVHDSVGGQNLHIRARDSVIEYNWIARAANYEIDMMPGDSPAHTMLFRGNVVVGHPNPENGSTLFTQFNDGGSQSVTMDARILWNTFVVTSESDPWVVNVRNDTLQNASVELSNNIVVGTHRAIGAADDGLGNLAVSGTNNWFETGADVGGLAGTIFGADPGFTDPSSADFTLAPGSDAAGAADVDVAGAPDREYFENEATPMMFRWRGDVASLGAFEPGTRGPGFGPYDDPSEPPGGSDDETGAGEDTGGDSDGGDETDGSGSAAEGGGDGDDGGDGGTTGGGPDGTGGEGTSGAASDTDTADGCSCRSGSGPGGPAVLWGVLLLARLRRTRSRRSEG